MTGLKRGLLSIRANGWAIPDGADAFGLCRAMLGNIGSTDPVLRDELILQMFCKIIEKGVLSPWQIREILRVLLSGDHLYSGLGKVNDDSVFNRSFSVLVIGAIIRADVLNETEILNVYSKIIFYIRHEFDLRGYVLDKGWAHSVAHAAEALETLARSKHLGRIHLLGILDVIKENVYVNYYTYINGENERLLNVFFSVLERGLIDNDEISAWIAGFQKPHMMGICPSDGHLESNLKSFLGSLYFRAKKHNLNSDILELIEDTLERVQ